VIYDLIMDKNRMEEIDRIVDEEGIQKETY